MDLKLCIGEEDPSSLRSAMTLLKPCKVTLKRLEVSCKQFYNKIQIMDMKLCIGEEAPSSLQSATQLLKPCKVTLKRLEKKASFEQFYNKEKDNNDSSSLFRRSGRKRVIRPLPNYDWLEEPERLAEERCGKIHKQKEEIIAGSEYESEYEKMRNKNLQEKASFLKSLGIKGFQRHAPKKTRNERLLRGPRVPSLPSGSSWEPTYRFDVSKLPLRATSLRLQSKPPEHVVRNFSKKPEIFLKIQSKMDNK